MEPVIDVATYEELCERPNFHRSLPFHPKAERRFGAVVAPYRFLDRIPCGIESCHTPHLSGYLITTSDGLETAIGSTCGKTHFGVTFTRERQRVDKAVERRRRIDTISRMLADMPQLLAVVESLDSEYKDLQDKKARLLGAIGPGLFATLKERANRGQSEISREVPMTKEEAAVYFETSNRKANDGKGWPTKSIHVATIDGLDFIKSRFKDMVVVNLIQPIRELSKLRPSDIADMKPRDLAATAKWVGDVPQGIVKAQAAIRSGYEFFTAENLEKLPLLGASASVLSAMIEDLRGESP